ncbi:MAG TPA: sigma-70 family RNA polymerase sigma factor [Candidatus Ozemobacteraceae bacterium]|nr:sigma-70 family RNA polymerase sigma factor [Candidatus Ozemobacteraceae bacterium]
MTDPELIERCLHGYPDDFRFLVQRYEKPLLGYLTNRLGNRECAREAAQEALVRAYFGLPKLEKPESFHSWLLGIGSRVALELYRSKYRCIEDPRDVSTAPAMTAEASEEYCLDEAIATLPDSQRQVLMLRYYEEMSCQQIAERLRIPLGTVTKTLSRAYVGLRDELEKARRKQMEKQR